MPNIHISNVDNNPAMCFDTGLDPRSFARTKMSQSLIEQGFVVNPDGSHEIWRASGVNETDGSMRVFGPVFPGKRLDILLKNDNLLQNTQQASKQDALQAVVSWMKAKLYLGDKRSALNPGASFVSQSGGVFFAPEYLSNRCLYVEGFQLDRYNCPDLIDTDITAFCAAVMLYEIFAGFHPYPSAEIYQDMREGVFIPMHLAAPDLDSKLSGIIQSALNLPVSKKKKEKTKSGIDILTSLLEILVNKGNAVAEFTSLFKELPAEKKEQIEKERKLYLLKQNSIINTRRFVIRNKYLLAGIGFALFFFLFITITTARNIAMRPTTAGMSPGTVVSVYYDAFSSLNHFLMDAIIQGADKRDVRAAANLYAVARTRQAHEMSTNPPIIQAKAWRDAGGVLPAPDVFGVTDLVIEHLGGNDDDGMLTFRTHYYLWTPDEGYPRIRTDRLTLKRDRHGNWRIIEILRTER